MKLKSTFQVKLESEDGAAVFTFRREKLHDAFEAELSEEKMEKGPAKLRAQFQRILGLLVSVDGLEDEGGPISADALKAMEIDQATMLALVEAYFLALAPKKKTLEEKNEQPA